jgi:hypothetical protein
MDALLGNWFVSRDCLAESDGGKTQKPTVSITRVSRDLSMRLCKKTLSGIWPAKGHGEGRSLLLRRCFVFKSGHSGVPLFQDLDNQQVHPILFLYSKALPPFYAHRPVERSGNKAE